MDPPLLYSVVSVQSHQQAYIMYYVYSILYVACFMRGVYTPRSTVKASNIGRGIFDPIVKNVLAGNEATRQLTSLEINAQILETSFHSRERKLVSERVKVV